MYRRDRWNLILRGERSIHTFRADATEGPDWYKRATRAHANCVENLPVFGALVAIAALADVASPVLDGAAVLVCVARMAQTLTHIAFTQTQRSVSFRFGFFATQLACKMAMAFTIASTVIGRPPS